MCPGGTLMGEMVVAPDGILVLPTPHYSWGLLGVEEWHRDAYITLIAQGWRNSLMMCLTKSNGSVMHRELYSCCSLFVSATLYLVPAVGVLFWVKW